MIVGVPTKYKEIGEIARFHQICGGTVVVVAAFALLLPCLGAETCTEVYVYVQQETPARSWFPVYFDGVVVAKIKRGRFLVIYATPGRHMISEEKGVPLFIDAQAGKKAFVRLDWRIELPGPAIPVWATISESGAHNDLLTLRYIDADKAVSKSVPKTEPHESPHLMRRGDSN